MNRGELWTVVGGVYAFKPRPALVVQGRVGRIPAALLVDVERSLMVFLGLAD